MELTDLPAHTLAYLVRRREISAMKALETALERISAVDGRPGTLTPVEGTPEDEEKVHAFITLTPDRARAQAEAVDRKISQGEDPGPLAGVPFTVKDIFCVHGTPSTAGSRILGNFVAPYTATPVSRMEAAGGGDAGKGQFG